MASDAEIATLMRDYNTIIWDMRELQLEILDIVQNLSLIMPTLQRGALDLVTVEGGALVAAEARFECTGLTTKLEDWHALKADKALKDIQLREEDLNHLVHPG